MGTGLLSLNGIIGKHPFEKKWHRITPLEYMVSIEKQKFIVKNSKENFVKPINIS
jgi:hypothetical protein